MQALIVAAVEVKQDAEGRYCINDLHRASGGQDLHKPGNWLRNQQTQDLIKEVEIAQIRAIASKQGLGTFVAKELVYAYAMWISPAFHLKVIRAYDALVTKAQMPQTFSEALRALADKVEEAERLQLENKKQATKIQEDAPKVESFEALMRADGYYSMRLAANHLGVGQNYLFQVLRREGVLLGLRCGRNHPNWNTPAAIYGENGSGYFVCKPVVIKNLNEKRSQTFVTAKGLDWVYKKLVEWGEISRRNPLPVLRMAA